MTYCTPYLLSLGMSKSRMSLVWIAGPLSGLVVQPIVGMKSDRSRNKFGRRRPYMLVGTAAVVVCYLVLGWTQEIVSLFVRDAELVCSAHEHKPKSERAHRLMSISKDKAPYCLLWAIYTFWTS